MNNVTNFSKSELSIQAEWSFVTICIQIACVISILGCFVMFGTWFILPEIRSPARQLLMYLTVAELLTATGNLYGISAQFHRSSWDCVFQSAITTFSSMASFFWSASIALYLFITIVRVDLVLAENMIPLFHLGNWGIPWSITVAAWLDNALGYDRSVGSGGWCWIKENHKWGTAWMILSGKIWEITAAIVLPCLYYMTKKHVNLRHQLMFNRRINQSSRNRATDACVAANVRLTMIPLVFVLLRMWGTLRWALYLTGQQLVSQNNFLVFLHGIGDSSQGTATCLIFCLMTTQIRNKCCPCFPKLSNSDLDQANNYLQKTNCTTQMAAGKTEEVARLEICGSADSENTVLIVPLVDMEDL